MIEAEQRETGFSGKMLVNPIIIHAVSIKPEKRRTLRCTTIVNVI